MSAGIAAPGVIVSLVAPKTTVVPLQSLASRPQRPAVATMLGAMSVPEQDPQVV